MSFRVQLATDKIEVEAGANSPLGLTIEHTGPEVETYEIMVEGLDPEWYALPVPTVTLHPNDTQQEAVQIKPLRASESPAGAYPFIVHVRSLESGEARSCPATLTIKAFHHLSVDVAPRKGILTPFKRTAEFSVTAMNLGNSEHNLLLTGTDTDDACEFEFPVAQMTLGPGQERTVPFTVSTTRRPLFANSRLYGLTVNARSRELPSVGGSAQAQIEQRALAAPGVVIGLLFLVSLIAFWIWSFPKAPTVEDLVLSDTKVMVGNSIKIDYRIAHATKLELTIDGQKRVLLTQTGSYTFVPALAKKYEVVAVASRGDRISDPVRREFEVTEPPVVPEPRILSLNIPVKEVDLGAKIPIQYTTNDSVVRLTLYPMMLSLDPKITSNEIEVPAPDRLGKVTLKLVAENAKGEIDSREVSVMVVRRSTAAIGQFKVEPLTVEQPGTVVTVRWQTVKAARAELLVNRVVRDLDGNQGTIEVQIDGDTEIQLRAYDQNGLMIQSKVVTVRIEAEPTGPQDPASGDPDQSQPINP
ncbi:MAG: hypothetical protein JST40_02890 [Armatimonadetes bacterium]|nr:hypothetical protein [Armatimonadota bacterium]